MTRRQRHVRDGIHRAPRPGDQRHLPAPEGGHRPKRPSAPPRSSGRASKPPEQKRQTLVPAPVDHAVAGERDVHRASSRPPTLEHVQSFDAPQVFGGHPVRKRYRYVDPSGWPMLYHTVPATAGELRRMRRALRSEGADGTIQDLTPHFLMECRLHTNLIVRLRAAEPVRRRGMLIEHLKAAYGFPAFDDEELYGALIRYVQLAHEVMRDFIEDFIPESLRMPFTPDGVAENFDDPVELLLSCAEIASESEGPMARTRVFEMRRTLVLAQELMNLDLGVGNDERMQAFVREFTELLEEKFFEPGADAQLSVPIALDERTMVAAAVLAPGADPPPGTVMRPFHFPVRHFRFGSKLIPVFFNPDQKRLPAILLKMLAGRTRDPNAIPDRVRFRMVCRNRRELFACIQRLHETVFTVGGTTHDFKSNYWRDGSAEPGNPASSAEYRYVTVDHWLTGRRIEGQYQTLRNYLNSIASIGPANHRRYKERRIGVPLRKLLLPVELYGVDWESDAVRAELPEG